MNGLIKIKSCNTRLEAEISKGVLTAHGIVALISADDVGRTYPHILSATGGAWLSVRQKDAKEALQLLRV